jgi:hypothetical protein
VESAELKPGFRREFVVPPREEDCNLLMRSER